MQSRALLDSVRQRRDRHAIVGDGVAFSVMVGVGETYVPAFALAAGLGELVGGLVASLPPLAGALLQLVTPYGVNWAGSHRRWVVGCATVQALSFVPLIGAALSGSISVAALFLITSIYWGFGMATSPAWNTWVGALIPRHERARFFANRSRWCQLAVLAGLLAGGVILRDTAPSPGGETLVTFAVLFALAAAARVLSAAFLARQSEPPLPAPLAPLTPLGFAARLRGGSDGPLLLHLLCMQFAVHIAAPFFTPYMLAPLGLSYGAFTLLIAAAFVARVACLPLWGRVAERHGVRRVLVLGALGVTPLPLLWLFSRTFGYLLVLNLVAGAAWAAFELAVMLAFFEGIPERERTRVLTMFNLANAGAMVAGAAVGGLVFRALGASDLAYGALFLLSTGARLLSLGLLRAIPPLEVPSVDIAVRTLAVRPSVGAVQRPVLASVQDPQPKPGESLET